MMLTRSISLPLAVALSAALLAAPATALSAPATALSAPATALAAPAAGATVVLNEINCEGTDWVELVNTSDSPADVSGWLLSDDPLDRIPPRADHRYLLPAATTIPPGEELVVEKVTGGFPFGISCGGDTIRLADGAAGSLIDEFVVPLLAAPDDTWGRFPDGTGAWVETAPTKGSVNEPSSAGGGPPPDASWLFDPGAVQGIDLTLPQATIDALAVDPTSDYHDATFSLTRAGGQTYGPLAVGVRLKGGIGSFRTMSGKAAFKLKFNFSVAGQRFQGLKKLTLNNMVQDNSMIHETLAYAAFRAVGVPAPRTGYAYVRVNGEDYGLYLDVETMDDVALKGLFPTTQHLYEGEYTDDVSPGATSSFGVDEGSATDRADLDALIAAVNGPGPWSEQVGPIADLDEMTREWAVERYIGHWDSYTGWNSPVYSPNNYFLHSDASGRFQILPWGADQTWAQRLGFDTDPATMSTECSADAICAALYAGHSIMFTECLADPICAARYRGAVDAAASTIGSLDLDALADATATTLAPWQVLDPRREQTLADIHAGVAAIHQFLGVRPADATAWLAAHPNRPPVVTGVPDRAANAAGWYRAPVTIDWQSTDDSGSASDPSDTVASTQGANVKYESEPSCDPFGACATGSLALSIDSIGPSLAPSISPATILLRSTATATPHATDAVSGVSSQSCGSPDTSSAGAHTLTCSAIDNAGNTTTASVAYVVYARLAATSIAPTMGPLAGGNTVVVKGTGFQPGVTVIFGTKRVSATIVNATTISTVAPAGSAAATVAVSVANTTGVAVTVPGGYRYVRPPVISSIAPKQGTVRGGTLVVITGSGFSQPTVKFGTATARLVVSIAGLLLVTTPAGRGTVDVTVTNADGQKTIAAGGFSYR